jgi:hypothetical protein
MIVKLFIDLFVTVGSKLVAAVIILLLRYLEKSSVIKHYKKKVDDIIKYK